MKKETMITYQELHRYLSKHYVPSYRKGKRDAYYNWRTNSDIMVPFEQPEFTAEEVLVIFERDGATELPAAIEFARLQLFLHEQKRK